MPAKWDLTQPIAGGTQVACGTQGSWSVKLNPLRPTDAVQFCPESESADVWDAVRIQPKPHHELQVSEVYVRENDLIVRFEQSASDQFALQLDWQLLEGIPSVIHGVELWVSIQTNLLDSAPELEISSDGEFAGWRVYQHAMLTNQDPGVALPHTAAALTSAGTGGTTRVWLIEPSDQLQSQLQTSADEAVQIIKLFGQFLEKGVVRRARMRFVIVDGELSNDKLRQLYDDFANSPLPLTA